MTHLATGYRVLMRLCGLAAALVFAAMALLITWDVVSRNLRVGTVGWINEVSEYGMPLATFLAAPWLLHRAAHVRLELLAALLPPGAARWLDRLANALGLAISLAMGWFGIAVILDSAQLGSLIFKTLVFPEWWLFVPLPFGAALLAIEFGRRLAQDEGPGGRLQ